MLQGQAERQWKGTYDLNASHHRNIATLMKSAEIECNICLVLFEEYVLAVGVNTSHQSSVTADWITSLKTELPEVFCARLDHNKDILSKATLSVIDKTNEDGDQESKALPNPFSYFTSS